MSPKHAGWTLIELLLVLAIVGILSSMALFRIQDMIERARVAKAIGDIEAIQVEIAGFEAGDDSLPSSPAAIGRASYLDPWGNPYVYVPPELVGVWATTAPGYEDRALEFTRASVILHTDDLHFTVHPIRLVRRSTRGLFVVYHLEYHDVDGPTALDFRFVASPQPLIRLEHLPYVWRRTTRR
jgi:prepilin-type N-terminal cleavage/methylation domain-containing protein